MYAQISIVSLGRAVFDDIRLSNIVQVSEFIFYLMFETLLAYCFLLTINIVVSIFDTEYYQNILVKENLFVFPTAKHLEYTS